MSERSSTTAVSASWPLQEVGEPAVLVRAAFKQRLLSVSVLGFLSGYYLLPNQWSHLAWMGLMLAACWMVCGWQEMTSGLRKDAWLRAVMGWLFVLLVRSSVLDSPGMGIRNLWLGWFHAGLLLMVLALLWQQATQSLVWQKISLPLSAMALGASLVSIGVFYVWGERAMLGARLQNWFVFGGWNSVCTGMTFGFAAVWALHAWAANDSRVRGGAAFWLMASVLLIEATLMTMSRGALVAMLAATLTLPWMQKWRRAWRPGALLLGCILLFQGIAPVISDLGVGEISDRLVIPKAAVTEDVVADQIIPANPMARFIERGDTGRLIIYQAAFSSMSSWQDWLWGKGLWSADDFWSCTLHWNPEHLHSVFMDAFVRGGLLGAGGLIFLLAWAVRRAVWVAQQGEPLWLMLVVFGAVGVAFDGASAFTTLSISRFETLLFWVPLAMVSGRFTAMQQAQKKQATIAPT